MGRFAPADHVDPHWVPRLPELGFGSSACRPVYRSPSGRKAREDVLEQALTRRDAGLGELADDLQGRGHELGGARRLDALAGAVALGLEPLPRYRLAAARARGARGSPRLGG